MAILKEILGDELIELPDFSKAQEFNILFVVVVLVTIQLLEWLMKNRKQKEKNWPKAV